MKTLYILGNGFDLHFGLHTSPPDFVLLLSTKRIFDDWLKATDYFNAFSVNWSEYEESLADFDVNSFFNLNLHYPDYLSDYDHDRDDVIFNMRFKAESLRSAVNDSLQEMSLKANDDADLVIEDLPFTPGKNDAVLSFNYTSTFEKLYLKNTGQNYTFPILHIHGLAENNDSLIFGYSKQKKGNIEGTAKDFYVEQQEQIVNEMYHDWQKLPKIERLDHFLDDWANNDGTYQIMMYGHSMGEPDMPYMNEIESKVMPLRWQISYHTDKDHRKMNEANWPFKSKVELFKW